MTLILNTSSEEQTEQLGHKLGTLLHANQIIGLSGSLGAGKTCFVRGLARGVDTDPEYQVTSPTFTLANIYKGPCPLIHFDIYRLETISDWQSLGFEDYLDMHGIYVIEWFDKFSDSFLNIDLSISISSSSPTERTFHIKASSPEGNVIIEQLSNMELTS